MSWPPLDTLLIPTWEPPTKKTYTRLKLSYFSLQRFILYQEQTFKPICVHMQSSPQLKYWYPKLLCNLHNMVKCLICRVNDLLVRRTVKLTTIWLKQENTFRNLKNSEANQQHPWQLKLQNVQQTHTDPKFRSKYDLAQQTIVNCGHTPNPNLRIYDEPFKGEENWWCPTLSILLWK